MRFDFNVNFVAAGPHLPYRASDDDGHRCYSQPATRHDKYLDELTPPLEVLRHHQRRAVTGYAHANSDHGTVAATINFDIITRNHTLQA